MAARRRLSRSLLVRQRTQLRTKRRLRRGGLAVRITVHRGSDRPDSGAQDVHDTLVVTCLRSGRRDVQVTVAGAFGPRSEEPLVTVESAGEETVTYSRISTAVVRELFRCHVMHGELFSSHAYVRGLPPWPGELTEEEHRPGASLTDALPHVSEHPWFALQRAWALRRRGRVDPASLEDALCMDAYEGLSRALFDHTPDQVLIEVERSGLWDALIPDQPVGGHWRALMESSRRCRMVVCRTAEDGRSDPLSRGILGNDPHAVIEGMAIAARAVGARQGVILCPGLPVAAERLEHALIQAHGAGLLGPGILGSDLGFHLTLLRSNDTLDEAETRTLASALTHSAETFASLGALLQLGAGTYRDLGTNSQPGTKLLTLEGDVQRPGLVEVPYGLSLRRLIIDLAGGCVGAREGEDDSLAIKMGGSAGTLLSQGELDLPLDPLVLGQAGATLGTGEVLVMRQGAEPSRPLDTGGLRAGSPPETPRVTAGVDRPRP